MIDLYALPLLFLLGIFIKILHSFAKKYPDPAFKFSEVKLLASKSTKRKILLWPHQLSLVALGILSIAFLDPHRLIKRGPSERSSPPHQGVAIYMNVDQSGSMKEEVTAVGPSGEWGKESKLTLLKEVSQTFIKNRPHDLIGLISFARTAYIQVPLTLDHPYLLQKLEELKPLVEEKESGTAIGYAVFKTVNLIVGTQHYVQDLKRKGKPAYEIKNSIIVLITDGFQNINPADVDKRLRTIDVREAAQYAKDNGIRLYVINVDPGMAKEEFAPHRHIMQTVTALTGGRFFIIGTEHSLESIYQDIERLEKSLLPHDALPPPLENYERVSYYPYLLMGGLFLLGISIILQTTYLRRFP